jgi:hypothetical protein
LAPFLFVDFFHPRISLVIAEIYSPMGWVRGWLKKIWFQEKLTPKD